MFYYFLYFLVLPFDEKKKKVSSINAKAAMYYNSHLVA